MFSRILLRNLIVCPLKRGGMRISVDNRLRNRMGRMEKYLIAVALFCLAPPIWAGTQSEKTDLPASKQAGIPITFHLDKESYVTLVIDDSKGDRVCNLVSETLFPAGDNTVYWNGSDDHGRKNVGPHGNYDIKETIMEPGEYWVRGLARDKINLIYEFTIYNPVNPPWRTPDTKGQWLSDHAPPRCMLFLPGETPQVLIGSPVAEGAHALVWVDLDGRKLGGKPALVGFAGAQALARDIGKHVIPGVNAYAGAVFSENLVISGFDGYGKNPPLFNYTEDLSADKNKPKALQKRPDGITDKLKGLAVRNGIILASLTEPDELLIISANEKKLLDALPVKSPKGLAFLNDGSFLIISGDSLLKYSSFATTPYKRPGLVSNLVENLDNPQGICVDDLGNIYISLQGKSHQVVVFDSKGKLLRSIGEAGIPSSGPYNECRMNHPNGLAIDSRKNIWVAEDDFQPKRASVWKADGTLVKAFYGPTEYGGGGKLDPVDKRRFYYEGMEFELDWDKGTSRLKSVFYRPDEQKIKTPSVHIRKPSSVPETPIYLNGIQYMTNIYNSNPVKGPSVAFVWIMRDGKAVPVAAVGQANAWVFLKTPSLLRKVPAGMDIGKSAEKGPESQRSPVLFAWSDLNSDGKIDDDEVSFTPGESGSMNVTEDLTFVTALSCVFKPQRFTEDGIPVYDAEKVKMLLPDAQICRTSGGDQVILGKDGSIALTNPPKPYPPTGGMAGVTARGGKWYYPSKWHGLHASQMAPAGRTPDPGELIGTTRVLGLPISFKESDIGEIWGINANSGVMYLFSMDGVFISTLFTNGWIANHGGPEAKRGMNINDMDNGGEGFWPTITKTSDGNVYLQAISHTSSLVRVEGLDSIKRIPGKKIMVTPEMLKECVEISIWKQMEIISKTGRGNLNVKIMSVPPVVDGKLDDWNFNEWITIEPKTFAAISVSNGRLYLAFRTSRQNLADNAGGSPWQALFKSGGGLDLMLSPERPSDKNKSPKAGDLRLLTAKVGEKHQTILYRPVSKGEKKPVSFSSPSRTIEFEQVLDVSKDVEFSQGSDNFTEVYSNAVFGAKSQTKKGSTYELSIPLSLLDIKIEDGKSLAGDIGILIGNGTATEQRIYWSNKSTTVVVDVPTEAMLTPSLWGEFNFEKLSNEKAVFENFKTIPIGDVQFGSANVGRIRIEPALKETGLLSITGECPADQPSNSLAVRGKAALLKTNLCLPFTRPEAGKGVRASFDVMGGSWNFHTQICFSDSSGKKTQLIDFGQNEKEKGAAKTIEFCRISGKKEDPPILENPFSPKEWNRIELQWVPEKNGTGGELFLKAGAGEKGSVSVGKTDVVPDTLVIIPGYRINFTNFKVLKYGN